MATAGPSERPRCSHCDGKLIKDDSGAMSMLLCESCGVVASDDQLLESNRDEDQLPPHNCSNLRLLSKQVRGQAYLKSSRAMHETTLMSWIVQFSQKAHLSNQETTMLKQQGLQLFRTKTWTSKHMHIAAGLVFITLRKKSFAVTFKEVSQLTGVPMKCLGRVVKWLQKQPLLTGSEAHSLPKYTFKESIQILIDKLTSNQKMYDIKREMNTAVPLTIDLKLILHGNLDRSPGWATSGDGALLALVLQYIFKDKPKLMHSWDTAIAELVRVKMITMKNRIGEINTALCQIALKLPSLEPLISSKEIQTNKISRYLHYFFENKSYLIQQWREKEPPKEALDSESESDGPPVTKDTIDPSLDHLPSLYSRRSRYKHKKLEREAQDNHVTSEDESGDQEESCSDINDSELAQYLATAEEVKEKRKFFKKNHIT